MDSIPSSGINLKGSHLGNRCPHGSGFNFYSGRWPQLEAERASWVMFIKVRRAGHSDCTLRDQTGTTTYNWNGYSFVIKVFGN